MAEKDSLFDRQKTSNEAKRILSRRTYCGWVDYNNRSILIFAEEAPTEGQRLTAHEFLRMLLQTEVRTSALRRMDTRKFEHFYANVHRRFMKTKQNDEYPRLPFTAGNVLGDAKRYAAYYFDLGQFSESPQVFRTHRQHVALTNAISRSISVLDRR